MTEHEKRIREAVASGENLSDTDLRALLADLDAMRWALEKIAKADNSESGCYYTNRANINIARAALKGASHE